MIHTATKIFLYAFLFLVAAIGIAAAVMYFLYVPALAAKVAAFVLYAFLFLSKYKKWAQDASAKMSSAI